MSDSPPKGEGRRIDVYHGADGTFTFRGLTPQEEVAAPGVPGSEGTALGAGHVRLRDQLAFHPQFPVQELHPGGGQGHQPLHGRAGGGLDEPDFSGARRARAPGPEG